MKHIIEGKPSPAPAARLVAVDAESSGQRLDNFLLRQLKGVPKTHVYRIIRSGEVRINKGRANAADVSFPSGECAMMTGSSGLYARVSKEAKFAYGIAPLPEGHHPLTGAQRINFTLRRAG